MLQVNRRYCNWGHEDDELPLTCPPKIEMYSWITRTALELIGQSGYGYSFDTLKVNAVEHRYAKALKRFM